MFVLFFCQLHTVPVPQPCIYTLLRRRTPYAIHVFLWFFVYCHLSALCCTFIFVLVCL